MSVKFSKAKIRLPVKANGQIQWEALTRESAEQAQYRAYQKSLPFSQRKPERTFGAVWMDDFVQNRQPVNLCEECFRRYNNWWSRHSYRPDYSSWKRGECDGCNRSFVLMVGFYPQERYFASLINSSSRRQIHGMGR